MGAFANRMKSLASRMLAPTKFGKIEATFTRDLNEGINPLTLQEDEDNKDTYTAKVAPVDIFTVAKLIAAMGINQGDLTLSEGEKMLYVEENGTIPQRGDSVSLDSEDWVVREVEIFEVQNVHCAYLLKIGK